MYYKPKLLRLISQWITWLGHTDVLNVPAAIVIFCISIPDYHWQLNKIYPILIKYLIIA